MDHLAPGATVHRKLRVANSSRERRRVEVYPGAATLDKERFVFGTDREANELTSWISLDKGKFDLEPGAKQVVEATVSVPPAASKGERYAVIWASVGSAAPQSGGVRMVTRAGVRIYLDIGPGGEPHSDFTINELTPARTKAGDPSLVVTVTNTGGRALDMTGSADLSEGPASQRAGPFQVTSTATLGPDVTGTVIVQFPQALPNGPWKVDLTLKSGLVSHSVTATITFPDPGKTGKRGTIMSKLTGPWTLAGGSLMTGLILLALFSLTRRHRRKSREATN
ncbi:hypothetical protein [Actinoplanes sp. NBRC 103695]|uniref:hypothetical protein n=1 Tax=Actinoplanes sp. NBRC 103695 TaxID=3032202 RepID=UPI0025538FEC|nr:hypothetical protein [Actinoplanes sp. NBRC 103695]